MKKFLCAATLTAVVFGLGLPAAADVRVDNILVNQTAPMPERTNIRVNMMNDGPFAKNPSTVELLARENANSPWHSIKIWKGNHKMLPGDKLSLDYLPARGEMLDSALMQPSYELQAKVSGAAGPMTSFEYQHSPTTDIR